MVQRNSCLTYDAGRLCLRATAASLDGRTIASSLPQRVLDYFGAKSLRDLKKAVYNPSLSKSEIAALGKIVVEQMRTGDKLAKVIINNCLSQLLLYVQTTASKVKLTHKFDLVISGSFISNLADLFLLVCWDRHADRPLAAKREKAVAVGRSFDQHDRPQ